MSSHVTWSNKYLWHTHFWSDPEVENRWFRDWQVSFYNPILSLSIELSRLTCLRVLLQALLLDFCHSSCHYYRWIHATHWHVIRENTCLLMSDPSVHPSIHPLCKNTTMFVLFFYQARFTLFYIANVLVVSSVRMSFNWSFGRRGLYCAWRCGGGGGCFFFKISAIL